MLTDATARALTLPAGMNDKTFFADDELPGFGVRVRAGGSRKWVVVYDAPGGATKRMTLGAVGSLSAAKARSLARDIFAQVRLGEDPAAAKAKARTEAHVRGAEIIGALLPRYLKLKAVELKPRSFREVERHLNIHGAPLHKRPIRELTLREAAAFLAVIADRNGLIARNRTRSSWAALYRWALGEGLVETNPFAFTNKAPESDPRGRTPSLIELAQIWCAAGDGDYGRLIKLLMLSGARRDEIARLAWDSEIDFDAGLVTLPGARTKNGHPHEIPITRAIRQLLEAQRQHGSGNGVGLVFGRADGGLQSFSGGKEELDARVTVERARRGVGPLEPWTPHDFRRSLRSVGDQDLKIPPHILEAVLGHVGGYKHGVTRHYNTSLYRDDKRAALERWGAALLATINGGKAL